MTKQILVCEDAVKLFKPSDVRSFGFDGMFTDPPYRAHVHTHAVSQSKVRGARKRDLGFDHLTPALRRWTAAVAANVKRWSIVYSDIESPTWWRISLECANAKYIRSIPWVRWSMPQLTGDRPPSGCELVILSHGFERGRKSWNGPGNLIDFRHKCLRGEFKHKAEKPLDQALDIVSYWSNEGDWIFDPFAGSGTFGLACKLLGRNYFGCEIDKNWHWRAKHRLIRKWLSPRDAERYARWRASMAHVGGEIVKRAA